MPSSTPSDWVMFTKRTDDPKLAWLAGQLDEAGIPHRRNGWSFHAPILEVPEDRLEDAWAILTPVDDVDDDDPMFQGDDFMSDLVYLYEASGNTVLENGTIVDDRGMTVGTYDDDMAREYLAECGTE